MPPSPIATILPRHAMPEIELAFEVARVVLIGGPRQSGKSTLAQAVCRARGGTLVSFDDDVALRTAQGDLGGFVERPELLAIDEFQRAGEPLLRAIKLSVDRDPRKGRFLLTGSSRFLSIPGISESLAGRVALVDLWPMSQGELRNRPDDFAAHLFGDTADLRRLRPETAPRAEIFHATVRGGFPAVRTARDDARRIWSRSYLRTIVQRDALDITRIRRIGDVPRILRVLAARTAQPLNVTEISRELEMPRSTVEEYLLLLENLYLWFRVPAWSRNLTTRAIKHPKAFLADSGLACHLLGASAAALTVPGHPALGPLVETFVAGELLRQASWTTAPHTLHHFRDVKGAEIDLVLEADDGRVACVEVKASSTFDDRTLRSLALIRDRLGPKFVNGVILYLGDQVHPCGDRLTLLPISALWA